MLGALLAFLAAAMFGLTTASTRRGVLSGTVMQSLVVSVAVGLPLFFIPAVISGQIYAADEFSGLQWSCFATAGVTHFLAGRYCNYRSIRAVGANLANAAGQVQTLWTLTLALVV